MVCEEEGCDRCFSTFQSTCWDITLTQIGILHLGLAIHIKSLWVHKHLVSHLYILYVLQIEKTVLLNAFSHRDPRWT